MAIVCMETVNTGREHGGNMGIMSVDTVNTAREYGP